MFSTDQEGKKNIKKTLAMHGLWTVGPMVQAPVLRDWASNPTSPQQKNDGNAWGVFLQLKQKSGAVRGHTCCN